MQPYLVVASQTGKKADAASFCLSVLQSPTQKVESLRPLQHVFTAVKSG